MALCYRPEAETLDVDRVNDGQPIVKSFDDMWAEVSAKFFEFTHFFEGPVPKQFATISEALDFHPRYGGKLRTELPSRKRIVERGARRKATVPELLTALVAVEVPKS